MFVTAWNNGRHHTSGVGYGFKVSLQDRDRFFKREWETVILELEGIPVPIEVNINKESFWGNTCRELISKEIGRWLQQNGLAPWPKGNPPKFIMEVVADRRYVVSRIKDDKPPRSK